MSNTLEPNLQKPGTKQPNAMASLRTNKPLLYVVIAIAVAVAFILILAKMKSKPAEVAPAKAVLTVETIKPSRQDWPMNLTVNGSVSSWQEAVIGAEIGGLRIAQVLVDVGTEVKSGQTLVLLADETVRADLQKQRAAVAKDRASLAEAKSNADRAREIKDSGALSTQQINQYMIAEETAQATLASSQAELQSQEIRLKQTHVIAPDDGVISARTANLGNVVAVGTELFRLVRQGRIEWRAEVNAQQLAQIHKGQTVHLTLPDGKRIDGSVRITAPTLDVNTRNALIYVDLPKASAHPGMYAQGEIEIGQQPALSVPQAAIILRDGRSYVYEVGADKRVTQRVIATGRRSGDFVEILPAPSDAGSPAGFSINQDSVLVATGGAFLGDGDLVSIKAEPAQTNKVGAQP